jgi:hypothetical protein
MKFCIISYDYFGYDKNILLELQRRNIDATHIDLNNFHFSYASKFHKIKNFFQKLFFKKNIKQIELKKFIFNQLLPLGQLDIVLVIRPDLINRETHLAIKKQTTEYVCYLYDSCIRFNIKNLTAGVFNKIYSFDADDVAKFGFEALSNFIYLEKKPIKNSFKNSVFLIISLDERINILNLLVEKISLLGIASKCIVVGTKKPDNLNPNIEFLITRKCPIEIQKMMDESEFFLDLIRKNHNGLSFRIFEALAMQRKLITTNHTIRDYPFYNPNNILILDENCSNLTLTFFNSKYEPLADHIYNQYTISNWVDIVFNLKK